MPLVFPVVMLLILGAVTLASRSTNSYIASSKQSDAQAARQAAESGMNRVLAALNPYGKNANDPYMAFLLASKWDRSTQKWTVLASGTPGSDLTACNLTTRGVSTTHTLASTSQVDAIRSAVIGTAGVSTELRYTVVDYSPPGADSKDADCSAKSSLSVRGGTARISVEGTVVRNKTVMARYTLTRHLDVQLVPMPNLLDDWRGISPGPPVGLRISNAGTGLDSVKSAIYADFDTDTTSTILDASKKSVLKPVCDSACKFANGITKLPTAPKIPTSASVDGDLPRFPQELHSEKGAGITPATITSSTSLPYTSTGLQPYCQDVSHPPPTNAGAATNEINCYISSVARPTVPSGAAAIMLTINTEQTPVNLIITGNVGAPEGPAPTTPPASLTEQPPAANAISNFVTIRHQVGTNADGSPKYYDHADVSLRPYWHRLRIFGLQPSYTTSSACTPTQQTFYIRADAASASGASLEGAFVWLPHGELIYGTREGNLWQPRAVPNTLPQQLEWTPTNNEAAPTEILSAWWLCTLTFNASGNSSFILPIYGNPDGLRSILPDTGVAPLFPLMPRIRSVF